ncbi:MAG: TolC family protein, partial [Clostridiales bacterium]
DTYNSLIKSRDMAKEGLRLSQLLYDNGLATIYDVQNADLAYQQAEIGLLDAIHNYNLAYSAFDYGVFSFSM